MSPAAIKVPPKSTSKISDAAIMAYMRQKGEKARAAARHVARADTGQKNAALFALADILKAEARTLLQDGLAVLLYVLSRLRHNRIARLVALRIHRCHQRRLNRRSRCNVQGIAVRAGRC